MNFGKYSSNDETITHNGTMLSKLNLEHEDIKCEVSFDLVIELTSGTKFTGNIKLELPAGNIISTGTSNHEKTNFKDVIFKRS